MNRNELDCGTNADDKTVSEYAEELGIWNNRSRFASTYIALKKEKLRKVERRVFSQGVRLESKTVDLSRCL